MFRKIDIAFISLASGVFEAGTKHGNISAALERELDIFGGARKALGTPFEAT